MEQVSFRQAAQVERALPQSSVYDILEDRVGFLWFGTREGVARWDGYEVRTWKHDPFQTASLPGNVVRSLAEDRFGNIWVQSHSYLDLPAGVARIAGPRYDVVDRFRTDGHVAIDRDGLPVLVTADSVLLFDSTRSAFREGYPRSPRPDRAIPLGTRMTAALGARDGSFWILGPQRGLERCDPAARVCALVSAREGPSDASGGSLWEDPRDGTLWIPGGNEVLRWSGDRLTTAALLAPDDQARDFSAGPDGSVWVLSSAGVVRIADGVLRDRARLPTIANTPNPAPIAIETDRAGTVWVGTVWGLYRYHRGSSAFGHLEHDPLNPDSPSAGLVVSLTEDDDGAIWIGTIGGGLNRWDRRTGRVSRFRHDPADPRSISHDVVWALATDSAGTVWAGTSYGLNRIEGQGGRFTRLVREPGAPWQALAGSANTITDLEAAPDGRIWFACGVFCGDSLFHYDQAAGRFGGVGVPGVERPGYLRLEAGTSAWIGSLSGIHRFDLASGRIRPIADSAGGNLDGVLAFQAARNGGLWVGANSGLYRYGPDGHLEARYTDANGLPSNAVYGMLEDGRGRIWVSTNRGLAVVVPTANGEQVARSYDHGDGLGNVEFNRNAFLATADGTFLFGGDRGVTWFRPDEVETNSYRPPVVITGVRRSTRRGTTVSTHAGGESVRMAPADYTFTFEFAALSYTNPHRNRYRVMLEGFDADWKDQGTERRATYTNVPPGRYRFLVRGSNDDGVWTETPAVVSVIVEPALWQTTWFRAVVVALVMGLISLATWYVSRSRYRLALEHARTEQALAAERARISRDMHDEVGASLTEIAILSELAGGEGRNGNDLARIGEKSRATIDAIGEIVWAIDPRNDDGDRFLAYLREYAADYLENTGLRAELVFPDPGALGTVTADCRRTVLLVLKESLANAVRHAGAATVSVTFTAADGILRLAVEDDGRGFDPDAPPPAGSHQGLGNMAARARDGGGRLVVQATPGRGTTVVLEIPPSGAAARTGAP